MRTVDLQRTASSVLSNKLAHVPSEEPVWVDLRYSPLDVTCLPVLLAWLEANVDSAACVGFTNISFGDLCRALVARSGDVEWIINGRVCIGADEAGRALDKIHAAGFMEGRQISMGEAMQQQQYAVQQNLAEASRFVRIVSEQQAAAASKHMQLQLDLSNLRSSCQSLRRSVKTVRDWQQRLTYSCDVLVT